MTNVKNKYLVLFVIAPLMTFSLNSISVMQLSFGQSNTTDGNSTSAIGSEQRLKPATRALLEASPQPFPLPEQERFRLESELGEVNQVPETPLSNETILGPTNGTEADVNATQMNSTQTSTPSRSNLTRTTTVLNTSIPSLEVVENRTLTPGATSVSTTLESSIANINDTVFYTGNWFAARSIDGGVTWGYLDPTEVFGRFCCDQVIISDPNREIFIWYMQGIADRETGENELRIGVSEDSYEWRFYTIAPRDINSTWIHQNSDYPSLSLSNNYLYISMNMFEDRPLEESRFLRPLMLRISLDDLANPSGIGPLYEYFHDSTLPAASHTFTPVQGVVDEMDGMYWGIHLSNNLMRIYEWSDSTPSNSVRSFDREVPAWTPFFRGQGECAGPDGNNWCARGQSKIRGAFMSNDVIGFFWDANRGGLSVNNATFTYPYIDAATFSTSNNMTYLGRPYLWSPIFAWMYGAGSPDTNGNVAIQAFFGGGDYYPSIAAGVGNDFSGESLPWQMDILVKGTNGPAPSVSRPPSWGDYITIRPLNGEGPGWIGSGWTLEGGPTAQNVVPRYFEFTLQSDDTFSTTIESSLEKSQPREQSDNIFFANFFFGGK